MKHNINRRRKVSQMYDSVGEYKECLGMHNNIYQVTVPYLYGQNTRFFRRSPISTWHNHTLLK